MSVGFNRIKYFFLCLSMILFYPRDLFSIQNKVFRSLKKATGKLRSLNGISKIIRYDPTTDETAFQYGNGCELPVRNLFCHRTVFLTQGSYLLTFLVKKKPFLLTTTAFFVYNMRTASRQNLQVYIRSFIVPRPRFYDISTPWQFQPITASRFHNLFVMLPRNKLLILLPGC